ncbi:MAG TPA: FAD-dependent oxidoreductase [Alphaproteobacteria bacterium]|nr:FAD-dependent oxidoreductase [Alphaproteobacteria bacterium]
MHRVPIAIVGGGPVGMMLALLLERHGVRSAVFNTEPDVRFHPKGSTHNARTMEHYRRLGLAEAVRQLGLPPDHPTDVAYFTRLNGSELARLRMPSLAEKRQAVATSPKTGQIPEPIHRANQMYVERALFAAVRARRSIALRFGWTVEHFTQDADGVSLRATDGAGEETWRVAYLVGCDGGRSFVRRALGIAYGGEEALKTAFFGGRMASVHLRAPTLYPDFLKDRRAFQYWVVNPELRTALVALDGRDEFLMWSRASDENVEADVRRLMRGCCGSDIPVEILAFNPWTSGVALVAERFAAGRVLLAGDAVHLFTPTGGFGMNTGIDDAANLSWKLAAMVQGWGGPNLLDSYENERKPIAIRNTNAARAFAKNVGDVPVPPEMEDNSPAGAAARAKVGAFLGTFGEEFASIGVQLGARYDGSPIVCAQGTPPRDSLTEYMPSSVPGGRAPHVWLDEGRGIGSSLFDRLGVGFTLLRLGPKAPDGASICEAAKKRGVPLAVLDVPDRDARDLYGCDLCLIRPDQHVAWRGDTGPGNADKLIARAIGT